jgi:ABC-2 type transport system permease protein
LSEFEKLKVVTRYELLKQFRRKRFYGALLFAIVAVGLAVVLYKGLNIPGALPQPLPDTPELFAMFVTGAGCTIAVLAAVFFAGDSVAGEFERGTGYVLFPNPVRRETLVMGKFIACFIAAATVLILAYTLAAGTLVGMYGRAPIEVGQSLGLALVFACSVLGLTFFFSSLLKGSMGATVTTLLLIMLIFPIIRVSLMHAGHDPWFMLDHAGDSIAGVYGIPFETFGRGGPMAPPGGWMTPDPTTSLFVMGAYFIFTFALSIWLTKRREML